MKIVQSGKYYVLYNDVGKVVIISRDKRVCSEILNSMEQFVPVCFKVGKEA